jgi:hypothetical protein
MLMVIANTEIVQLKAVSSASKKPSPPLKTMKWAKQSGDGEGQVTHRLIAMRITTNKGDAVGVGLVTSLFLQEVGRITRTTSCSSIIVASCLILSNQVRLTLPPNRLASSRHPNWVTSNSN